MLVLGLGLKIHGNLCYAIGDCWRVHMMIGLEIERHSKNEALENERT